MNSQRAPSGGWGIVVPFFLAMIVAIWPFAVWHGCQDGGSGLSGCGAGSDWVWNGQSWTACGIWWGLLASPFLIAGVARLGTAGKRRPVPPKGRLRVEVLPDRPVLPPPSCLHPNAVRVESAFFPEVTLENWCPDCEISLGAAFRWFCCGASPGLAPGEGHVYNCPHLKEHQR